MGGRVVVIGAGMGGLLAALRLARRGLSVRVLEARDTVGGLASSFACDGLLFDTGPYVLLDRWGLEWALSEVGLALEEVAALRRLEELYVVEGGERPVHVYGSLDRTVEGLESGWPGSGAAYRRLVARAVDAYARLQPLLTVSDPRRAVLRHPRAWPALPFLMGSLRSILESSALPAEVARAVAIWTAIAGQRVEEAPAPMAFVPALVHGTGAFYVVGGMGTIAAALERRLRLSGVEVETATAVARIQVRDGRAVGIETVDGRRVEADAVVSDVGLATYARLVDPIPGGARPLLDLPLQSPGVCAYLGMAGEAGSFYLRFRIAADGGCRLLVAPRAVDASVEKSGRWPARLIAPLDHARARAEGEAGQQRFLDGLLEDGWWRNGREARVCRRRVPADWGRDLRLYADAMNPVMTARMMRRGRLAHRSPWLKGLYLAGAATHPGQWVSFAAISGVLAADRLAADRSP